MTSPCVITAAEAMEALPVAVACARIQAIYAAQGRGEVQASGPALLDLGVAPWGLGAKGAILGREGVAGLRLLSKAQSHVWLWSLATGVPLAIVDETLLHRYRTGLSAAIAARILRPRLQAPRIAIIGTGPNAAHVARGMAHVFAASDIRMVARDATKTAMTVAKLRGESLPVRAETELAAATRDADIIVTMTTAKTAFLTPELIDMDRRGGRLILSMGGGAEVAFGVWRNAAARYVDEPDYAFGKGDLAAWIAAGAASRHSLTQDITSSIGRCAAGCEGPPHDDGVVMAIVQGFAGLDVGLAFSAFEARQHKNSAHRA